MNTDRLNLVKHFQEMSDEELIGRCGSGTLTELAQSIAIEELAARGIELPDPFSEVTPTRWSGVNVSPATNSCINPVIRHGLQALFNQACGFLARTREKEWILSKLAATLAAVVFATGTVAGTPAWADRGFGHYDRGHPTNRFHPGSHRDGGANGWAIAVRSTLFQPCPCPMATVIFFKGCVVDSLFRFLAGHH